MITIKDIAKRTGVSYTTVSRALNGKSGVNSSTRDQVLTEAKRMGYQPNGIARGLVKKYTNSIGLIIPDITNPFFPAIARGVEDEASKHGYTVFLCNTNWNEKREMAYLDTLQEKRVDGIIIKPAEDNQQNLEHFNIPMVSLNTKTYKGTESYVDVDNEKGGFLATKHLIESGYRRIAFIGGKVNSYSYSNEKRIEGYQRALKTFGISVDESIISHGEFTTESGYEQMNQLFKRSKKPDAVFAGNDLIALGVMNSVQEFGLNIPMDFGVVGFDNIYFAKFPQIQLTTIAQPVYDIGRIAFELLLSNIKNKEKSIENKVVLEPELIIRKTTTNRNL